MESKKEEKFSLRLKDKFFILITVVAFAFLGFQKLFLNDNDPDLSGKRLKELELEIKDKKIMVEVAENYEDKFAGLSFRKYLPKDAGMLFVHETAERHSYSMRGMLFDLDFIFIKGDKVVDIARKVAYEYKGNIQGATDYDKVLEVNADWVRQNDIEIGDEIVFIN